MQEVPGADLIAAVRTPQPSQMPQERRAAAMATQLINNLAVEKSLLMASANTRRQQAKRQTQHEVARICSEGANRKAAIEGVLARREQQVDQRAETARNSIQATMQTQSAAVEAEGQRAVADLRDRIRNKRTSAIERSGSQADRLDNFADSESQRIQRAGNETQSTIDSAAASAISGVGSVDADVRSAVAAEVNEVAADISGEARDHSTELSQSVTDAAEDGSGAIRDAGREVAGGINGEGSEEVINGIRDAVQATIDGIMNAGGEQLTRVDELNGQAMDGLGQMRAELHPSVDAVTEAGVQQAQEAGESMRGQIDAQARGVLEALDGAVMQGVDQLAQLSGPPRDDAAAEFNSGSASELARGRAEGETLLGTLAAQLGGALSGLFTRVSAGFSGQQDRVEGKLSEFAAEVDGAAGQAQEGYSNAVGESETIVCDANEQSVSRYETGLEEQVGSAERDWIAIRVDMQSGIVKNVDDGISRQVQVREEAPAQLAETAREAAADAQSSLLSQIWSGIVEGLGNFFTGLLYFVAAVLVVFVVIMVGAILLGITVVAAKVLAIAILIVGVAFLIYGFITTMIRRSRQFWQFWGTDIPWWGQVLGFFQVFTVSILDTFGVGGILEGLIFGHDLITWETLSPQERARRATEGILTVAFILLVKGLVKKLGGPGPGEPPTRPSPIIDPNTGRPVGEAPQPRPIIDPNTGRPVGQPPPSRPILDPRTGRPVGEPPAPRPIIDPNTGRPAGEPPPRRPVIDPVTGRPVGEVPGRPPPRTPREPSRVTPRPPRSWDIFKQEFHEEFRLRLRRFRESENMDPDPGLRGGEGQLFRSRAHPLRALKRWFERRLNDMPRSIQLLRDVRTSVEANATLRSVIDVVRIHERGSDWVLRDFSPDSVPLRSAMGDAAAVSARTRAIAELEAMRGRGELNAVLRNLLKKLRKDPPSANLHWNPGTGKIIVIDMQ